MQRVYLLLFRAKVNIKHVLRAVGRSENPGDVELVSKELNHFGGIALFFRDWAPGTLTGGE